LFWPVGHFIIQKKTFFKPFCLKLYLFAGRKVPFVHFTNKNSKALGIAVIGSRKKKLQWNQVDKISIKSVQNPL
jgi:hypothetical protein